jgi:DNA-binding CsgD family transcriptional regulator
MMTAAGPTLGVEAEQVLTGLAELGPPSEVQGRSPGLAARALDLDRVLLSSIENGTLAARALYLPSASDARELLTQLQDAPVALGYPLIEGEIMRRRRAQLVATSRDEPAARAFAEILGWTTYAIAPIVVDGRAIGFFHADRQTSGRDMSAADAAALSVFATCFGLVYERAVLRQRLLTQRKEMRRVADWADARTSELGERAITLNEDHPLPALGASPQTPGGSEHALYDLLTRRELDVLRLIAHGETNPAIAKELVLSEATVKFHVKNILRKMHAANRAEATSRYLRLTLNRNGSPRR